MTELTFKTKVTYHILLSDAKAQLNIEKDFKDDDDVITQMVKDATSDAENYMEHDVAKTTNVYEASDFYSNVITLLDTPFISLESISYLDAAGDSQSITVADCTIKKALQKTLIVLPDEGILDTDLLTVNFTTGHLTASTVKPNVHRAIMMRMSDYYDVNRGSMVSGAFKDSGAFERALQFEVKTTY